MTVTCSCCAVVQTDAVVSVGVLQAFRGDREQGTLQLCIDCLQTVTDALKRRNVEMQRRRQ